VVSAATLLGLSVDAESDEFGRVFPIRNSTDPGDWETDLRIGSADASFGDLLSPEPAAGS
jgi:hypothetical protein